MKIAPTGTKVSIIIDNSQSDAIIINKKEIVSGETEYTEVTYDISDYGTSVYAYEKNRNDGEFRKSRAEIPFEYLGKTMKDFNWDIYKTDVSIQRAIAEEFVADYEGFVAKKKGIYIYSKTKGSGKTLLACCILQELLKLKPLSTKFTTVLDLMELTKKEFKHQELESKIDSIFSCKLLAIDDIGTEMKREFTDNVLYRLINHRQTNNLLTIFTSNVPADCLKIDERISQRILKMTIPLIMPEVSIRSQKAKEENDKLIKDIMQNNKRRKCNV